MRSVYAMPELSEDHIGRWQKVLEAETGINLAQHRHILREALAAWLGTYTLAEQEHFLYRAETSSWRGLGRWLVDYVAIKETRFYRNPAAYRELARYLMGRLRRGAAPVQSFDLWSAGCSTGEETYTLAMIASDIVHNSGRQAYVGVIGSDISSAALQLAKRGEYGRRAVGELPEGLRQRYLQAGRDASVRVNDELRRRVCFVQANLLESDSAPTSAMDVIFCHNVLVYFRYWRQKQVLNNLVARLKPGGMLVIGPGEASGWSHAAVTRVVDGKVQVFRRDDSHAR